MVLPNFSLILISDATFISLFFLRCIKSAFRYFLYPLTTLEAAISSSSCASVRDSIDTVAAFFPDFFPVVFTDSFFASLPSAAFLAEAFFLALGEATTGELAAAGEPATDDGAPALEAADEEPSALLLPATGP